MKTLAVILAAIMTAGAVSLAGCTEKKETNDTASDLAYIQDKGTLVIGITNYEPMDYLDENNEWTGFDAEFAEAVCEKLGVKAEFIEIEWDSKIMEVNSKSIDCVWNGMTLTDEVTKSMDCSVPYVINAQVVVTDAAKADEYSSVESLAGLSFVAEAGSAGQSALEEAGYTATEVGSQTDALMEVYAGSADACVIDITMANAMTGEGTSYASLGYGLALSEEKYGIGFRKGSDAVAKVNEIIGELYEDGTLPALAEKYQLTLAMAD